MSDARRVYIYEVKLCREDGGKGSGWGVIVMTDTLDPHALLRVARIEADRRFGDAGAADWIGLEEVKLLHTGVLDPTVAP